MYWTKLFPNATDVLALSREEIGSYILEHLNADAKRHYNGEDAYTQHHVNYLNGIEESYSKNRDVTDNFVGSWRWLVDQGYLAEVPNPVNQGWYRLTAKGRAIKTHDQLQVPRVPRDMNPGPSPNFGALSGRETGLRKQLDVLWEEAVMAYNGNAHLSTVIMLGSLLEGALLAKCLENDTAAKGAASAPKEHGRVKDYGKWSLSNFIEVADDNRWIHQTRNDFADVLRDYRNMVHPFNAYSRAYRVDKGLATICWEVVKATLGDLGVKV